MKKTPKVGTNPEDITWKYPNGDYYHRYKTLLKKDNFVLVEIYEHSGVHTNRNLWIWHLCGQYSEHVESRNNPERAVTLCGELSNSEIIKERCQYCKNTIPAEIVGLLKMALADNPIGFKAITSL